MAGAKIIEKTVEVLPSSIAFSVLIKQVEEEKLIFTMVVMTFV